MEWSIRPAGLQLRWMFPAVHAPRPGDFALFRRPAKRPEPACVDLTIDKDRGLMSGTAIGRVTLHVHEHAILRGTGGPELAVESSPLPATAAPVHPPDDVRRPSSGRRGGVRGPISGAPSSSASTIGRIASRRRRPRKSLCLRGTAPLIDHATLWLDFAVRERLCVHTHAQVCAEDWDGR